jgi:4'-phosphopantetheinyl transferase
LRAVDPPAGTSADSPARAGWAPAPDQPELPEDTVDVWRAKLTGADERLGALLCEQERARAGRLLSVRSRLLWTRSRGLLRVLLGRYLHEDPRALRFAEEAHGKPLLLVPADRSPRGAGVGGVHVSFNLSHSGELALYAFCAGAAVGVDVEGDRRSIDEVALAARVLGASEAAHLRAIADPAVRRREFLKAWTRYEAQLKCLGTGIGAGASGLDRGRVWVADLDPGGGAAGAVACAREPRELRCWTWR